MQLGDERLLTRQILRRDLGKGPLRLHQEVVRTDLGVHPAALAETALVLGKRPVFVRARRPCQTGKSTRPGDQAQKSELQGETRVHGLARGSLAGLVVDDAEATIRQPVDPIRPPVQRYAGHHGLALLFCNQRFTPLRAILANLRSDPVDGLQQPRLPQGAQHRMNGLALQQFAGTRQQEFGVAIVLRQPFLQHLVNGASLPRGGMIGIDRLERAQAQHRLRVEGKGIGLEAVHGRDGNALRSVSRRR